MEDALSKYLLEHCSLHNEALDWLERQTHIRTNYPRMLSGPLQGEFLYLLVKMLNPKRILEIGTFTGYSTICMALALGEDGRIITMEKNDELEELTREGFKRAGVEDKIDLLIGDALALIEGFELVYCIADHWDMVFIDADKREYKDYYEKALYMLRPGGVILADDTLWDGKVYADEVPGDKQTQGIVSFNQMVANDPRVESVILPVRHGLTIIRKK